MNLEDIILNEVTETQKDKKNQPTIHDPRNLDNKEYRKRDMHGFNLHGSRKRRDLLSKLET